MQGFKKKKKKKKKNVVTQNKRWGTSCTTSIKNKSYQIVHAIKPTNPPFPPLTKQKTATPPIHHLQQLDNFFGKGGQDRHEKENKLKCEREGQEYKRI